MRLTLALLLLLPLQAGAADVSVFAAASLQGALEPVAEAFERQTGDRVRLTYAGSSLLARQIIAGAPADIFLSASPEWMDAAAAAGVIQPGSRHDLLGNELVLIAPDPTPVALTAEAMTARLGPDGGRLAIALTDAVPAGRYGRQALEHLGLWDAVVPRLAQTDDVRGALALVAAGEAHLGVVYATDAAAEPRVHVVARFPAGSHDPIIYPVALTTAAEDPADSRFLDALRAPEARAVFAGQGFTVLP